jgi:CIC family chloride channel protein
LPQPVILKKIFAFFLLPFSSLGTWFKARHFGRSAVDTRYALAEACLIGCLSGVAALLLKQGVGWLGGWRVYAAQHWGASIVLPTTGLLLGLLAGWLLETFSPAAAGGGIPQVKAALARYPMPLSLRVALVKAMGTILVLGAGLTLGRRAPTVHIGAALAAQLSSWIPTSPDHRRQMIAAGAAAGLAAGFNTPIAGVLFVIEELMRDASGLTLETAVLASFTGSVVSRLLGAAPLNIPFSVLSGAHSHFFMTDIPVYMVLGILAGILGAFFNRGMLFSLWLNRRLNFPLSWRIGLAGLISGIAIALLPPFFRDNTGLREFLITGELTWQNILIAFIAHFFLTMLAYSSGAPGGLFAPALVMGSALGYLVGEVATWAGIAHEAASYAFAGMGAFFTGVVRVPVTAIVIVFEITADFNLVLPLMITCALSYIVAESAYRGSIYEYLLKAIGIRLQEEAPSNDLLSQLTATDVMQSQVETLASDRTLDEVLQTMSRSSHRGFPVVEGEKLIGIITQTDIANLSQRSGKTLLKEIMTPNPIAVNPTTPLSDVLYLLNRYQLSRLPVVESRKLIGIITRTDIIRTEVKQMSGETQRVVKPSAFSYIVYQTRSPSLGKGRILLPLANPENVPALLKMAAAIATAKGYELECLQVIEVPKHSFPEETQVKTQESRKVLHRVERLGRHWNIPVHTQIRVAHDKAEAILEALREQPINLLLLGWKGRSSTQGTIFGNITDTLIRQAPCDLMLVKLGRHPQSYPHALAGGGNWLVPMAGGPNAKRAIAFLPALTSLYRRPEALKIWLCQVHTPAAGDRDEPEIERAAQLLREQMQASILPICIQSHSVSEAIIHFAQAENCQVVMLGASREGLLQQVIHGNIPEAIAQKVDSTVIVVRGI